MKTKLIGERYEIQQQLGKNTGRRTFLVSDTTTQELAVIKLLLFDCDFQWHNLKFFEREVETLKSLSHPAIPRYLNSFEINSSNFKGFALVQTYIEAKSLEQQIKDGLRFTEAEIKQLAKSLLEILIYLHSCQPPVIHRDIKPSNILLNNRSGNSIGDVYLVDFGSVQTLAATEGGTITVVGTYGYMPPEQFGGRTVPASDLYSLGATLIYLITRTHPADSPLKDGQIQFEQVNNISPYFINWLQQMTQPSLDKRFTSASQALESLQEPKTKYVPSHKDASLATVSDPDDSKIKFTKNNNYLDISLPSDGFEFYVMMILGFGLFSIPSLLIVFFGVDSTLFNFSLIIVYLLLIVFSVVLVLAVLGNPSMWIYKSLRINQQQIISTWRFWGLKIINYSAPRQDIVKLVYIPGYCTRGFKNRSIYHSAKLIIWVGVRQLEISGLDPANKIIAQFLDQKISASASNEEIEKLSREMSDFLNNEKMKWLAQELSNWLNLPITRV